MVVSSPSQIQSTRKQPWMKCGKTRGGVGTEPDYEISPSNHSSTCDYLYNIMASLEPGIHSSSSTNKARPHLSHKPDLRERTPAIASSQNKPNGLQDLRVIQT